jgi:hypothetical protein
MAALAISTKQLQTANNMVKFDTDSKIIGVDNRCTACISHDVSDFITDLRPSSRCIKGFGSTRHTNVMTGTIQWKWCDDEGKMHRFTIPNSYYVPEGKVCLMSSQHWAKQQKDKVHHGTGEFTDAKTCTLYWSGKSHQLTIPLSMSTNVATFALAPGFDKFHAYCTTIEKESRDEDDPIIAHPAAVISDDEAEAEPSVAQSGLDRHKWKPPEGGPRPTEFALDGPQDGDTQGKGWIPRKDSTMSEHTQMMLKIHQKLGHISFCKIQILAKEGTLPKEYAKCDIPVCTSCTYATMTKCPWRGKQQANHRHKVKKEIAPGDIVSVDQMVSPTHGFIAQMTGILTTSRYKYATVYVNQGSHLGYTYLQKTASAEETIKGKIAFELYA